MKNEYSLMKICNVSMNNKVISENTFRLCKNVPEDIILKLFGKISSIIDIQYGQTKAHCSRTTLEIINIKQY